MNSKRIGRASFSGAAALAIFALSSAAQAELVSYDFTASILHADTAELASVGLPSSGEISGSFSYDSEGYWRSSSGNLGLDGLAADSTDSDIWLSGWLDTIVLSESYLTETGQDLSATLLLWGQDISGRALPTSLSLADGGGYLAMVIDGGFLDLKAKVTSLVASGSQAVSTPELDPASGSAALVLLLGGAALVMSDRRRKGAVSAL